MKKDPVIIVKETKFYGKRRKEGYQIFSSHKFEAVAVEEGVLEES